MKNPPLRSAVDMIFEVDELAFEYQGAGRRALDRVGFAIPAGALYTILGPNGSGKSTLLKILLGKLAANAGEVYYRGRPVADWERRSLAKEVGVVAQAEEVTFPLTVRQMVAMGRYPHLGPWRPEGPEDVRAIEGAMEQCEVRDFTERPVSTLSGGERQRVRIARALAQRPTTLVLDEPTAALDIHHEMAIFELLARLVREASVTVVMVTHHVNLAARYASHILLLNEGRMVGEGSPAEVLTQERVERIYEWPVRLIEHPGPGRDTGAPQIVPLAGTDVDG